MKYILSLIMLSLTASVWAQTPYCKPRVFPDNVCQSDSWISNVVAANVNNPNNLCDSDPFIDPQEADGYSDYSNMVVNIDPTQGATITVALSGLVSDVVEVWVDWNANGDFEQTEYLVLAGESTASNFTGVLLPPVGAITDSVITGGLRVIGSFLFPQQDPCTDVQFGEIEDYSFIVTSEPPVEEEGGANDYCYARPADACNFEWIQSFECNNILVDDGYCDLEEQSLAQSEPGDGYSDYSHLTVEFAPAEATTCTLTVDGNVLDQVAGWIDWDNSGTWDTDEIFYFVGETTAANMLVAAISVPQDAVTGVHIKGGFRVMQDFLEPPTDPCTGPSGSGEVEDYSFIVLDPDLVGCPSEFSPADGALDLCEEVTFTWNAVDSAAEYQVQIFSGGDTALITEVSDTTITVPNLLRDNEFQWLVRSIEASGRKSFGCDTLTFTTNPAVSPKVTFNPLNDTICLGVFQQLAPTVLGTGSLSYTWTGDVGKIDNAATPQPLFNSDVAGDFSLGVEVRDEFDCASSAFVFINTPELAAVNNASVNSQEICFGEELIIDLSSNADSTFILGQPTGGSLARVNPNNIANNQYFIDGTGEVSYLAELYLNGCPDTVAIDVVEFKEEIEPLNISFELEPDSLPCMGNEVVLRATNYTTGLEWQDGTTNDTLLLTESTDVTLIYREGQCSVRLDSSFAFDPLPASVGLSTSEDLSALCDGDKVNLSHDVAEGLYRWADGNTTDSERNFNSNAEVYVDFVSENGCVKPSDTLELVFKPLPESPSFTQSAEGNAICEGETMILGNTDDLPKVWNTGSTMDSIEVDAEGEYFIQVSLDGCTANSDTLLLRVNPLPISPEIEIFPNGSGDSIWSRLPAEAYQWYINGELDDATTRAITGADGSYVLIVVNEFGCESEASETFTITGISELAKTDVQLRYNTANGAWRWSSDQAFSIKVWSVDAKLLLEESDTRQVELQSNHVLIVAIEQDGVWQRYKLARQ